MDRYKLVLFFALSTGAFAQFPSFSSGGAKPCGSLGAVQFSGVTALDCDSSNFEYFEAVSAPVAPVLATVGTPGATTLGYKLVYVTPTGTSAASVAATIGTANAVLNGSNYVTVTAPACPQVNMTVDVYLTTGGGNVPTTGFLANIACSAVYNHQGLDGDGSTAPSSDTTKGLYLTGVLEIDDLVTLSGYRTNSFSPNMISDPLDSFPTAMLVNFSDFDNPRAAGVGVLTGVNSIVDYYGSGVISNFIYGLNSKVYNETSNSPSAEIYGGFYLGDQYDTGTVSKVYGIFSRGSNEGGTAGSIYGGYFATTQTGLATTNAYGVYVDTPIGTTATNNFALWAGAQAGSGTNSYSFWSDEQGVYRIRSDNTFDSVYQAIPALYNPQFTKYTPGAVNYERCIPGGQWNGNVCQVGTEAGGTGTLRRVQFIGQSVQIPTVAFAALGTPSNGTQNNCSDCTVTSAIDNTCAASGTGSLAVRINGAWKCVI